MSDVYHHIEQASGRRFAAGDRVTSSATGAVGIVAAPYGCELHYVRVLFEGERRATSCEPKTLASATAAKPAVETPAPTAPTIRPSAPAQSPRPPLSLMPKGRAARVATFMEGVRR